MWLIPPAVLFDSFGVLEAMLCPTQVEVDGVFFCRQKCMYMPKEIYQLHTINEVLTRLRCIFIPFYSTKETLTDCKQMNAIITYLCTGDFQFLQHGRLRLTVNPFHYKYLERLKKMEQQIYSQTHKIEKPHILK